MKVLARLLVIAVLAQTVWAVDSSGKAKSKHRRKATAKTAAAAPAPAPNSEVIALRDQVAAQQQQLQQMQGDLQKRDAMLENIQSKLTNLESTATQAQTQAQSATQTAQQSNEAVNGLQSTVTDLKTTSTSFASEIQEQQKKVGVLADLSKKVKIGTTVLGAWTMYTHTGFGPQWYDAVLNQPGPFNAGYNSFDITRAYLNFFFTPVDAITFRVTPDIYRQVDNAGADTFGKTAGFTTGQTEGNLGVRLKYAYLDFNTLFKGSEHFKKDKLTVGQTTNPLVDWEEGLNTYRMVYLVDWNHLSLSSTYTGIKLHGPIEFNGKEYLDYDIGVFNNASFHSSEVSDKKQGMGRVTFYPFGTKEDRTGLGLTAFEDYGYANKAPDTRAEVLNRFAAIVFYQDPHKNYELGAEFDLGHNAMSTGNMFSGSGPLDEFSYLPSCNSTACSVSALPSKFANYDLLAKAALAGAHTRQQGYSAFGYYRLGHSPFRVFGFYEYWLANTNLGMTNPLDFQRPIGGISYAFNKHLEFALAESTFHYTHSDFSAAQIAAYNSLVGASKLVKTGAAQPLSRGLLGAAQGDTNALMINMQFTY